MARYPYLALQHKTCLMIQGLSKSLSAQHAACEHGRRRRPGRFFAVCAPCAFPSGRHKAHKLQKRIMQRQSLYTNATFEKPCLMIPFLLLQCNAQCYTYSQSGYHMYLIKESNEELRGDNKNLCKITTN